LTTDPHQSRDDAGENDDGADRENESTAARNTPRRNCALGGRDAGEIHNHTMTDAAAT